MPGIQTAGIVIIGNEILSGKVTDINSPYLCQELRFLGVEVARVIVIPDEFDLIGETVRMFSEMFTWVFTSGGIGPTHDDLTVPAIAKGFGVELVECPEVRLALETYYQERLNKAILSMAMVPQGYSIFHQGKMRTPQVYFRNVFIFPGIPELLRNRFDEIKEMFRGEPIHLKEIYLKIDEGEVAHLLHQILEGYPDLLLGSYPSLWRKDYTLRLTLESKNLSMLEKAYHDLLQLLPVSPIPISS